jgi:hypothetical protein
MANRRCGWGPWTQIGDPEPDSEDPEGLLCVTTDDAETAEESETAEDVPANVLPLTRRGRRPARPQD